MNVLLFLLGRQSVDDEDEDDDDDVNDDGRRRVKSQWTQETNNVCEECLSVAIGE